MGLLNKVKNIFFEEVEVEEDEIKEPKEKKEKEKKEKPVAKKIELPKAESRSVEKKVEEDIFDLVEEDVNKKFEEEKEREKRISMDFDDNDFKIDEKTREYVDMPTVSRREKERTYDEDPVVEEEIKEEAIEEEVIVEEQPKYEEVYGMNKEEVHGLYEGKQNKRRFTPTPVISPVYGILDKNYKKEDVVTKKEIRLSTPSNKKLDLDTVREKAYGDLSIDISNSMEEVTKEKREEIEDTVYDLNTNSSPEVEKVTIGDADEYYNELGLEYNVDYKDNSTKTTKTTKRRSSPDKVEEVELLEIDSNNEKNQDTEELESNLFDLVDSMYEDKE